MKQQDCLRRFLFEDHGVRGEWVRLNHSWREAKRHQALANAEVESQLGQVLAATVLLSATIKFKGAMIMQIQGQGEVTALVAQATNERKVRVLARSQENVHAATLREMVGEGGRLVLTVESDMAEPYQGIVGIVEEHLAGVLKSYFDQSEQLNTRLWLFADKDHSAGLFIQELPDEKKDKEDWRRIEMLADTVTEEEMFTLDCEQLLHRLFHEEKVRLYEAEEVEFRCNCSRQKIGNTLKALGRPELDAILQEQNRIEVDCQFCGAKYYFDKIDVEHLMNHSGFDGVDSPTQH